MKCKLRFHALVSIVILISIGCKKTPSQSDPPINGGAQTGPAGSNGNIKPPVANAGSDQTITILNQYPYLILNGNCVPAVQVFI